jgi:hypothetical protein
MGDPASMTARHTAILARLADAGERLAMKQAQRALEADDPEIEARATNAFHRAARTVRQCLALEAKLVRDARRAERQDREDAAPEALPLEARWRSARRKRQVREIVEEGIEADADGYPEQRVLDDLNERLADSGEDADFADLPIGELVARIFRDLGITPDWSFWEDEPWAIEEATDKPAGSPYANWLDESGTAAEPPDPELRSSA